MRKWEYLTIVLAQETDTYIDSKGGEVVGPAKVPRIILHHHKSIGISTVKDISGEASSINFSNYKRIFAERKDQVEKESGYTLTERDFYYELATTFSQYVFGPCLTERGNDGWELVQILSSESYEPRLWFKRPIEELPGNDSDAPEDTED